MCSLRCVATLTLLLVGHSSASNTCDADGPESHCPDDELDLSNLVTSLMQHKLQATKSIQKSEEDAEAEAKNELKEDEAKDESKFESHKGRGVRKLPSRSGSGSGSGSSNSSSATWNYKPMTWIANVSSLFPIQPCAEIKNANGVLLPAKLRQALASEKKTKCMQVYGTLIAGTAGADSNAMRYSANIVAQLLDPNCKGTPAEPKVANKLDMFKTGVDYEWTGFINYGTDSASEESAALYGSFSSQIWKAQADDEKPALALEEAFHMVHQKAWAEVYPHAFGYKAWGNNNQSVACRCMREAQCNWYQHPENGGCTAINGTKCYSTSVTDVFKKGTIPGTCSTGGCSDPSCDCLEFFHKVETTWLGNKFNGYDRMGAKLQAYQAQGLNQRQAVEKLLSQSAQCSRLLQLMKDPKIALPKMPIKETYQCTPATAPAR